MHLPNMDRFRNQVIVVLIALAFTVVAIWYIVTLPPHNSAEANWIPPKSVEIICHHKGHTKTFYNHPANYEQFLNDLDKQSRWQSKHYPYNCEAGKVVR